MKRGQITVFIIAGIAILLTIALLIIFKNELAVFKPDKVLPPDVVPVQRFIENCVQTTARDGITLLSANGGLRRFIESLELESSEYISTNPLFQEIHN